MKKDHWIIVLFLVSVCCFSTPAKAKTIELISPKNEATVNITNKKIKKWWNNYKKYSSAKNDEKKDYTEPDSITLKWKKEKGCKYRVCVSTNPYFKDMTVYSSKNCQEKLKRLLQDETYYWKVIGIKGDEKIVSETRCFETNDIARIVDVPNTTNVRDLGGYETDDGAEVKQGMIFRSSHFDDIESKGKKVLNKELGIKTDLDLRKDGEGKGGTKSPAELNYIHIPGAQYERIFEKSYRKEHFIKEIKVFADPDNYPIIFHCAYGRDRTGTLAFVINGLLGVDKKDLFRDYELTYLTEMGSSDAKERIRRFNQFYNKMQSYENENESLSYNIECYLLDNGVTKTEISNIKEIMLSDNA